MRMRLEMERLSVGEDKDSQSMARMAGINEELERLRAEQAGQEEKWQKERALVVKAYGKRPRAMR